jgi:ElaB/YqjD/DUF883 family membrane-anchored ribosome-binding protein
VPVLESLALKAALGSIKDVVFDGLGWVVDHPWQSAAIGAGAWLGWLLMFTVPGLKSEAEAEKRAHQVTKQNYTTAMAQAEKRFAEAWSNWEERYRDMATETDNAERDARIEMLGFAERHIANNRVRCEVGASLGGPASGATGAATSGGGSEGVERPDQVSELVAVRPDDVRICTENTSRLKAAQEWASGLQQADTQ